MKISKVVIEMTVLLPSDEVASLEGMSLADIERETFDGTWIGSSSRKSVEAVPPENVSTELKAIGNDGSFFNIALSD